MESKAIKRIAWKFTVKIHTNPHVGRPTLSLRLGVLQCKVYCVITVPALPFTASLTFFMEVIRTLPFFTFSR